MSPNVLLCILEEGGGGEQGNVTGGFVGVRSLNSRCFGPCTRVCVYLCVCELCVSACAPETVPGMSLWVCSSLFYVLVYPHVVSMYVGVLYVQVFPQLCTWWVGRYVDSMYIPLRLCILCVPCGHLSVCAHSCESVYVCVSVFCTWRWIPPCIFQF